MAAFHTLRWRVAVRELKALHQKKPEVPLATQLNEEEEPVAPPSAEEGPRPDGPEPQPALPEAPVGLFQFWTTPTQVWGQPLNPPLIAPFQVWARPSGVGAAPFQVWAPPSGVGAAPIQVWAPPFVVGAAPPQSVKAAQTQEVRDSLSQVLGAALMEVLSPPVEVSAPPPEVSSSAASPAENGEMEELMSKKIINV